MEFRGNLRLEGIFFFRVPSVCSHCHPSAVGAAYFTYENEEENMTNSKEIKIQETQLQDETLSEFCASEATMGGSGQYREAGVGRFL